MAARKPKKSKSDVTTEAAPAAATEQEKKTTAIAGSAAKKKVSQKAVARRAATPKRRRPGRPKGSKNKPAAVAKIAAKKSTRPRRYTPAERAKILAAAKREGLSGPAAAKKFGISQLTFYTWRRKSGTGKAKRAVGRPRGASASRGGVLSGDIGEKVRQEVRARVSEMLPAIIQSEIDNVLGVSRGRR